MRDYKHFIYAYIIKQIHPISTHSDIIISNK